jgi:hypothetical protein
MKTLARARDKAEVLRRMRELREQSAARWGRMSAHQMVCHLCDAYRMATGQKLVRPSTGLLQQTILRWVALYAPMAWPAGIHTSPEIDQERGGTRPVEFAADVKEVEALVELMTSQPERVRGQVHPIFGRMSQSAWLRWAYLHIDHHLRQFGA